MKSVSLAVWLGAVSAVSALPVVSEAAASCPFADGNGVATGECLAGQGTWETSLLSRDLGGDGTVDAWYDPFLDLTWLADANSAQTSGFDDDGLMTFTAANAWASGLVLLGGSDWRLPTLTPVNDTRTFNTVFSNNGSTDRATARTGVGWGEDSEMGYMHYVHLGNRGRWVPNDANPGSSVEQAGAGLVNTGPFANLLPAIYWTGEPLGAGSAWYFNFDFGFQSNFVQVEIYRAWAVHPGDLIGASTPVPAPGAALLLVSALAGAGARARRR